MQRRIVAVLVLCGLLAIADAKLVATYLSGSDADTSPIPAATLTPTGAASSGAADSSSATTGTDPSCKPAAYVLSATDDARDAILAPSWVIDPVDPTALIASGNRVANGPCPGAVVDVAGSSPSDVVALCSDHSARRSGDKGMTWRPVSGGSDAFTVAAVSGATFAAYRAACGIAVGALVGGDRARCVAGTKDWSGPGDMTIVDGTIWLATSDKALTTPLTAGP